MCPHQSASEEHQEFHLHLFNKMVENSKSEYQLSLTARTVKLCILFRCCNEGDGSSFLRQECG